MSDALAVVKKAQDNLYVEYGLNRENFFPRMKDLSIMPILLRWEVKKAYLG